ncbi:protein-L-isoaspartate(D-aspartate) O-methyltransferase [Methylophaga pinxianii]|uniref:protein-L-isoaspartate(D-aspartate) O-methyltransferase n=1 Tax=Methylophaga pinxianii TaxID=2881052 RepID=UPI001CF4AD71|nr:protein-L-isoaspartate(D-aspartate) O-methyltransferase [Methylophaga pinxianii]MCB2426772.1 protein-L-isoaspartate(D-aspartate) O-methyltransferase [Methylophaga pinxianii]UPH46537.1 protein-L-isoaspartate(D-aspartate) O-methyltransferase [Methylophaga pinxianii]
MIADPRGIGMTSQRTRDRLIQRLQERGIKNIQLLSVMRQCPRHLFVDEALASRAYEDTALPIGLGQTISQPYIVARMTEILLQGGPRNKVLEVGTGSGYQTAVLSELVPRVFSVERIAPLLKQARERFYHLKLNNIRLKHSDGNWGWPENGPYDGIIVTCGAEQIPPTLLEQLAPGGRLVIPVGGSKGQILKVIDRIGGKFEETEWDAVSFVPLLSGQIG